MSDRMSEGLRLRKAGLLEESRTLFLALAKAAPDDARANYQCAWAHDVLGREREAIPFYERAIRAGLAGDDLEGALLGLGSSYRCVGDHQEAVETLRNGSKLFPESRALRAFLAIALQGAGESGAAVGILLRELAETSSDAGIARYKKALLLYGDELLSGPPR